MEWFIQEDGIRRNRYGETHPVDTLKILYRVVRDKKVDEPIKELIESQWKALPSQVREPISATGAMVGSAIEDTLDKSRKGLLGPGPFVASRLLQGVDKAADWATNREGFNLTDITRMSPSTTKLVTEMMIMKKIPKVYRAGSNINRMGNNLSSLVKKSKTAVKKSKTAYQERFSKDPSKRIVDVKAQVVDEIFNEPGAIIRRAREIYRNHPDAGWTAAMNGAKQIKDFTSGSLRKNSLFSPNRRNPNLMFSVKDPLGQGELFDDEQEKFPRKKLSGKGEDLTKPTLIPSNLDKGGYSVKDLEGAGPFDITGEGEFREFREFAGAMQDPRFSKNDFYLWQKELSQALLKKYPEMTKEELAIRHHHFNPLKQGARLINGLPIEERAKAVAFLAERGVFSGNTPAQDYAIPNRIHTKVHDFINDRIGKQLDKLYDKVNLENLTTFESRKSYIKKYARVIRQSEEFIYKQLQKLAAEKQAESKRITGWEPWVGDALKELPPEELVDILDRLPGLPDYVNEGTYERVSTGYQRLLDAVSGKKPKRVRSRRAEFESNLKRYAKSEGIYEDSAQLNMWSNLLEDIFGVDREE